ncbi:uncharacterized protein LOC116295156 [Actinia tenebrosa]|uniref:Uncharacterized protein LOC116295156 n=1 Tax=Actinia tenebrosa TaxID=6105 RepID=A0A6P8I1K7_ACTTE|nr:uncharacterized protein LOC116295156 [Actinia tenebrosa]
MNLYEDSVIDDLLVRGEQARQKRSHKRRRLKPDEVPDNTNLRLETQPQQDTSSSNWFKEMISYPCTKRLSLMESFTLWSAILLYLPIGLFVLLNPGNSLIPVMKDNNIYTTGYQRICGIHTIIVAFLCVIFSRAIGSNSIKGVILGTILIRTVYASACLYLLYIRQYIPISILYITLAIDAGLSFITFILWFYQNPEASLKQYFKAIWQLINPSSCPLHSSSNVVQVLGFIQCILGMFFFIFPNIALLVFQINPKNIHGYSKGWLSIGFMSSAAIGFIHALSGGVDSKSYNIAVISYRIIYSIPVVTCLGLWGQIPSALGLYYVSLDGICAFVTFIVLYRESLTSSQKINMN